MKHETQVDLTRRMLAHIEKRTTDAAPEPSRLDVAAYLDEARHARERDVLFRRLPIVVGHVSRLEEAGDFFTHDLCGVPLLVVRRDDGAIAAYLNVCRHRGTRVEGRASGSAKAFACPYHGWTYARDGRLAGVPHQRGFLGMVKGSAGSSPSRRKKPRASSG
jgi:phenylpropionate dioxygenase-like ring-hydroxylating dioxygenase large terminal subunit